MKALTVTQPWASLIVLGKKRYETRAWATSHRGPLVIHAAKRFPAAAQELCHSLEFAQALREAPDAPLVPLEQLPVGHALGVVDVVDCYHLDDDPNEQTHILFPERELAFGDFRPGRWAWALENPRPFSRPVAFQGHLGLWEFPDALADAVLPFPMYDEEAERV